MRTDLLYEFNNSFENMLQDRLVHGVYCHPFWLRGFAQSEKCAVEIIFSASSWVALILFSSEVRTELQNFETLLDVQLNCSTM